MRSHVAAIALTALAGALAAASPSAADVFGPTTLLSIAPAEQAIYARDPAVSADGRYVVFDGDYGGQTGVWRRPLAGGGIEAVSVGPPHSPLGSAALPSISADGRYVSFTTTAQLDPVDDVNEGPDVYVRDMSDADDAPCARPGETEALEGVRPACAFTLASARDGSDVGLSYAYGSNPSAEQRAYGAVAAGRSALSADGQKVAFVTTAASDLDGPGTPALQVAVRDVSSERTQLVSVLADPTRGLPVLDPETGRPEPVAAQQGAETYGAVYTGSGGRAPFFRPTQAREAAGSVGASISADGSTVAWMGTDIGLQTRMLGEETQPPKYTEPLWRRIADGPTTPTLRVTGGSEPSNPSCSADGEGALPSAPNLADPCQGPLATLLTPASPGVVSGIEGDEVIPRLSADGWSVAFLSNAPPIALAGAFGLGGGWHADAYVADMRPGPTRREALTPLTQPASGEEADLATTAPILDLAISPDGTQVAFATKRTQLVLTNPSYISAPSAAAGMVELFDADLADETVTRVTQGFEGGPSERPHLPAAAGEDPYPATGDGALSPSFTADGDLLVYSSTASNLVYGDGNSAPADEASSEYDGSDVFATSRVVFGSTAAPQLIGPAPAAKLPVPAWMLDVIVRSRPDGSVVIELGVPGAGEARASAVAVVPRSRRGHAGSSQRRGGSRHTVVASASLAASGTSAERLVLRPSSRFANATKSRGGLHATVLLTFAAKGHGTLRRTLPVTFRKTKKRGKGRPHA